MKRYLIIMLVGILLNLGLYQIAHVFHLPVWMDSVGTAYTAIILEPAAGLLVAFATNFYQAAVVYDSSSLVYYAVSAMAALCIGITLRKQGRITWKRLGLAILLYFIVSTILSTLLTLWRTAGIPDSAWERKFYEMALDQNLPNWLSCLFGTAILKFNDCIILAILLPLFYKFTPKTLRNEELEEVVSWKHSYFHKAEE